MIAYGKEKGFHFTEEDMKVVTYERLEAFDELSDADLENVAGGAEARTLVAAFSLVVAFSILFSR